MNEEEVKIYSDNAVIQSKKSSKPTLVTFSSIKDKIHIHIDSHANLIEEINKYDNKTHNELKNQDDWNIYDVYQVTKLLNVDQIKELIYELLDPNFIDNTNSLDIYESCFVSNNQEDINYISEVTDDFGLNERTKGQKLTQDQIKYIKNFINNSQLSSKEVCQYF